MATYKEIQYYVKSRYNVSVKTCWIADAKEYYGLPKRVAVNRISMEYKSNPCPNDKKEMIKDAFKHFNML